MKKRRLVGVMFIVSSLLLPIGYAASFNMPVVIASGERYEVGFETIDFDISGEEQYIEVQKGTSDRNSVNFSVANIYPGANFRMEPVIKNYGTDAIKINAITVQYTGGDETFFSFLRGNDDQGQSLGVDEYNRYLVEKVKGRELKANESLRLELSMGLAPVITDLKNVDVGLRLTKIGRAHV